MAWRGSVKGCTLGLAAAAVLLLAGATAGAASPPVGGFDYSLLADQTQRARLEPWLARLPGPEGHARIDPIGAAFAACLSAWRDDTAESTACIQSRIVREANAGWVVLHAQDIGPGEDLGLHCIGAGGTGRARWGAAPDASAFAALDACVAQARAGRDLPPASAYAIRSPGTRLDPDKDNVRANAAAVLVIAVDHVGLPRGVRGVCLLSGRIREVARGAGQTPRGAVDFNLPCHAHPDRGDGGRIDMAELRAGSHARLYLDASQTLLDYERITP